MDGPVELKNGKIVGHRWKVVKKLGAGGCGAVYKVDDLDSKKKPPEQAALKAESNFVSGGSVLKLEVQILSRLEGRPHVTQLIHSGKRKTYSYMVVTLLGENLETLTNTRKSTSSISTQVRVGINVLFGMKQLHEVGFVHRDLKPANVALGRSDSKEQRFLHVLDFGLSREFVIKGDDGTLQMRRPRSGALFRGTPRYCSIGSLEKQDQGRVDDLWSLVYMLAELREQLPWAHIRDKLDICSLKKNTPIEQILSNSPVELVEFAAHLSTLNYYSRPDYALLFSLLEKVMKTGQFKFTDPWDWEKGCFKIAKEKKEPPPESNVPADRNPSVDQMEQKIDIPAAATGGGAPAKTVEIDPENPFAAEEFKTNRLGF